MTTKQTATMQKTLIGFSISVIITLLGIMTTLMFNFSDHLMNFEKDNNSKFSDNTFHFCPDLFYNARY